MSDRRKRILVVDDDDALSELLKMVLEDAGYEVTLAPNGREALFLAAQAPPDLVLLDVMMPDMDGWETSDHLLSHERTARIPVIFLSALAQAEDQLRGWYRGCFDYLTKPFDIQELQEKVSSALSEESPELEQLKKEMRRQRIAALEQIVGEARER